MTYVPADDRYDTMPYRRTGRSGLKLPVISLGRGTTSATGGRSNEIDDTVLDL